jgi:GNAT superfamily N-acetyltransferase
LGARWRLTDEATIDRGLSSPVGAELTALLVPAFVGVTEDDVPVEEESSVDDQARVADEAPEVEPSPEVAASVDVTVLTPGEAPVLRDVCLAALRDSPGCFTASVEELSRHDHSYWHQALLDSTWFVARDGACVIAVARVIEDPEDLHSSYMESVWVERRHRRRGVLRQLLEAIEDLERSRGVERLRLWVLDDNMRAQKAYLKLGFDFGTHGSDRQELNKAPGRSELRMNKSM